MATCKSVFLALFFVVGSAQAQVSCDPSIALTDASSPLNRVLAHNRLAADKPCNKIDPGSWGRVPTEADAKRVANAYLEAGFHQPLAYVLGYNRRYQTPPNRDTKYMSLNVVSITTPNPARPGRTWSAEEADRAILHALPIFEKCNIRITYGSFASAQAPNRQACFIDGAESAYKEFAKILPLEGCPNVVLVDDILMPTNSRKKTYGKALPNEGTIFLSADSKVRTQNDLSVLAHELGHVVGFLGHCDEIEKDCSNPQERSIMHGDLKKGFNVFPEEACAMIHRNYSGCLRNQP